MEGANQSWIPQCAVAVQSAALNDALWPDALLVLRNAFEAAGAALETWNAATSTDWSYITAGVDPTGATTIQQLYPQTNPRLEANRGVAEGDVTFDYRHFTEEELNRCGFVRAMEVHTGTRYYMGALALRTPAHLCSITLLREPSQGHFSREQISRLQLLLPILKLALRTSVLVGQQRALSNLALAESAALGIVLLDRCGRISFVNAAASKIAAADGISLLDGLCLARSADTSRLQRLIGGATEGVAGAMRVARPSGRADLEIICMPVPVEFESLAPLRPRVAIIIRDPDIHHGLNGPVLKALFGLTDREVEVGRALVEGLDPMRIAGMLGMSVATVRVHIRNLLHKTNTHSQRELVSRLVSYRSPGVP